MDTAIDFSKVTNLQFEGIDHGDRPDYCDAYVVKAYYDGRPATEEELEQINDDTSFVQEKLFKHLH